MNPLLYFDFKTDTNKKTPLLFQHPIRVVQATVLEEVLPALAEIQQAVDNGYYAAGYLSYEAAPAFDQAAYTHGNPEMPLLWFGVFDKPIHKEVQSYKAFLTSPWKHRTTKQKYETDLSKIKQHIENGDTYQVNYTVRMDASFQGDPLSYFTYLNKAQSANYSAYLDIGNFSILSASPELFFHLKEGKVTTRPMKGTIGRGNTPTEDAENTDWLYHSEKNRAENVMIVDLLRNDLGAIAVPGTVKVPKLFSIESYPTVHQMTSTVTAEITKEKKITDIFKALFPCGSITGAPKLRTMKVIHELENESREVYCGAIGYITPENEAIFNVPIRTVILNKEKKSATYGVGGGITWDSVTDEEYDEVSTKAKVLSVQHEPFQLLESIGYENSELFLLDLHMSRLQKAADYFNYQLDVQKVKQALSQYTKTLGSGPFKLRLLSDENGEIVLEANAISSFQDIPHVAIATKPVDMNHPFLYHKTTNRSVYTKHLQDFTDVFDVLLWNKNKEVTEFTTGNVVVNLEGRLYTPPTECGLLAGTYRQHLLENGEIEERKIMLHELHSCSRMWLINSVRKWIEVKLT